MLLVACLWAALAGCCKRKSDAGETPSATGEPTATANPRETRAVKIDSVIKCFNAAMRINKSADYYFRRLRGGKPSELRTPSILLKPQSNTSQLCDDAKSVPAPAMPEIDKLMPNYASLTAKLTKQLDEMDQYYRTKEYKSDKFGKGIEMHEAFKKDHEAFQKLHDQMSNAIDAVTDKRDDETIQEESAKKGLRYHSLVFLRDAKMLSREISREKPDAKVFGDLKAKLEANYEGFSDHASANPDQVGKAFMFSMYKSRADDFIGSVRSASPKPRERDLGNMLDKYNAMIDASNLVKWRE
jgi:hypothetical protein